MVRSTISCYFITFIKTFSWKSLTKNKVKGHIYQDIPLTGSIYVIKYRFSRKSRKSGFLPSQTHAQACLNGLIGQQWGNPLTQVPILFVERYVIKSILFSSCNAIMGFLKMDSPEGATGLNKSFYIIQYYIILYNIIPYYTLLFPIISGSLLYPIIPRS